MPSGPADRAARTGRPLLWVAGFVLLGLVGAITLFLATDREVITPPAPSASGSSPVEVTRADRASELLQELTEALTTGTRRDAARLAAPGEPTARGSLAAIHDNVRDLGVSDLSLRFIDEELGGLSAAERRTLGDEAWVGTVALDWRIKGYDTRVSTMEVSFTFVDTPDGVAFGSADGDHGNPAPLWLLTDLAVAESQRALVAVADERRLDRYAQLADEAVRDVRDVLPQWRGRLVVEVPSDKAQLHRVLDAQPNAYDSIAAVTATVDGSMSPTSPVHILVNPDVFGKLGEEGSQIVMSHEATHVATNAATASMPLWLLEGFADYVALARSELPVEVTGSQILAEVRRNGPPKALPGPDEFDPANKLLGTSYESAWLACRLLAETYGEDRLIDFYESVDSGVSVDEAFTQLGTTERAFTKGWRAYLRELAG
ncbi:MAG TPA: hypothetical protein VLB29_01375 [Nocardioidaceae bacterium]|nr:hypothetical protein [Nocardioidaceae bacterium]